MEFGAANMTTEAPPAFSSNNPFSNLADIKLDEKTREDIYTAVADTLASADSQSELLKKIDQVAAAVTSTRATFTTILASLRDVSLATSTRKSECNTLVNEWEGHFKTFDSCVLDSRRVAAKAHVVAEDFAREFSEFLNDISVSLDDKKLELAEHKKLMMVGGDEAKQLHLRFNALSRDVDNFSTKWHDLVDTMKTDTDKARADLEAQRQLVKHVNSELTVAQEKTSTLAKWLCGVGALTAAVTIGVMLAPVTLTATGIAIGTGVGGLAIGGLAGAVASEYSNTTRLNDELAAKTRELDAMVQESTNASTTLSAALLKKDLDFASIIKNIGLLSDIWSNVAADISGFEQRLDFLQSQKTEGLFYKRLNATAPLYLALAKALRKYALAIPDKF